MKNNSHVLDHIIKNKCYVNFSSLRSYIFMMFFTETKGNNLLKYHRNEPMKELRAASKLHFSLHKTIIINFHLCVPALEQHPEWNMRVRNGIAQRIFLLFVARVYLTVTRNGGRTERRNNLPEAMFSL